MPIVFSEDLFKGNIFFDKCVLNLSIEIKKYDNDKEYYYLSYLWNYENNDIKNRILNVVRKVLDVCHIEPKTIYGDTDSVFIDFQLMDKITGNKYDAEKVVCIDWDVHHGNGTESIFIDDPNVLTISLHQNNLFPPDSGCTETTTHEKSNLNIPLPPGSGSGAYRTAFERLVLPAVDAFEPHLIIIASGFDSCALDPLGMQMLSSEDYRWMTRQLLNSADKHCEGRVVATHEGGYSATYVPYCGLAVLEELSGASEFFEDPFKEFIAGYGGQSISNDQLEAIKAASIKFFTSTKKGDEDEK